MTIRFILFLSLLTVFGCAYDVEEELYPPTGCNTINVSYSGVVLDILDRNCFVCHSAAANRGDITLETYGDLKVYAANGLLLGAIKHEAGFSPMPQSAPALPDCDIDRIEAWVNDGAPNN